jgi:hypothetical protein
MPVPLMQFMRVMQDPLVILLPTTPPRMYRTMPLYPRIMLPTPRHLMRRPTIIRRLSHRLPRRRPMRRHRALAATTLLEIALPRMMKPATVLHVPFLL